MNPGHVAFEQIAARVDAYIAQDLADRASRPARKEPKPKPVKPPLLSPAERSARMREGIAKRRLGYQPKPKKAKPKKAKPEKVISERGRAIAAGRARAKAARQAEQQQ